MDKKDCRVHPNYIASHRRESEKWLKIREESQKLYFLNPKLCKFCQSPLSYAQNKEGYSYCTKRCARKDSLRCRKCIPRYCQVCNKKLISSQKRCCSFKCYGDLAVSNNIERWKKNEHLFSNPNVCPSHIRKYLFKKYNNKCFRCGWSKVNPHTNKIPLQVEHLDGDSSNNREDNLELICPCCHSLTATYGALNKGRSKRTYRPLWLKRRKEIV